MTATRLLSSPSSTCASTRIALRRTSLRMVRASSSTPSEISTRVIPSRLATMAPSTRQDGCLNCTASHPSRGVHPTPSCYGRPSRIWQQTARLLRGLWSPPIHCSKLSMHTRMLPPPRPRDSRRFMMRSPRPGRRVRFSCCALCGGSGSCGRARLSRISRISSSSR